MERTVQIDGRPMRLRASALIPRLYRFKFGHDMMADMAKLTRAYKRLADLPQDATEEQKEEAQLEVAELTIFENVAYLMAKHAGEPVPDTPEAWLDGMDGIFSVYEVLPVILELWGYNMQTTAIPKKK